MFIRCHLQSFICLFFYSGILYFLEDLFIIDTHIGIKKYNNYIFLFQCVFGMKSSYCSFSYIFMCRFMLTCCLHLAQFYHPKNKFFFLVFVIFKRQLCKCAQTDKYKWKCLKHGEYTFQGRLMPDRSWSHVR